jgi:biopolymer transport protein TolQ
MPSEPKWLYGSAGERDTATLTLIFAQVDFVHMIVGANPVTQAIMIILLGFSLLSFTIFFSKFGAFRRAKAANQQFLRAFRKTPRLDAMAAANEQFRAAPLAAVFQSGYNEVARQVNAYQSITNPLALERSLQLGTNEEVSHLEKNMSWLATTAAVAPFIGLLGTVIGIIDSFALLSDTTKGAGGISAVGPGISEALFTTGLGLFAAIPAAIMFNYFSNAIKEMGQRMEDFGLEFLNAAERNHGER